MMQIAKEMDDTEEVEAKMEYIREKVQDAMSWHFAFYSFENLIDDTPGLNDDEKRWAKENLDWVVTLKENDDGYVA